jgi:hypothetical protein
MVRNPGNKDLTQVMDGEVVRMADWEILDQTREEGGRVVQSPVQCG